MKKTGIFFIVSMLLINFGVTAEVYLKPSKEFKPRLEIAAVYIQYNELILLLHRQEHKSHGNKWAIPGGKIEKTETSMQAAIREVFEETGYDISNQFIETLEPVYVEHNEKDHFIHHMFLTRLAGDPSAVKINFKEHKGFTWVSPSDALKMALMDDEAPCINMFMNRSFKR